MTLSLFIYLIFHRRAYWLLWLFCSSHGHWTQYSRGCLFKQLRENHTGQRKSSVHVSLIIHIYIDWACEVKEFIIPLQHPSSACRDFTVSCSEDIAIDRDNPKWYYYFLCGVKGIKVKYNYSSSRKIKYTVVKCCFPQINGINLPVWFFTGEFWDC